MKYIVKPRVDAHYQNGPKFGGPDWNITQCWLCSEDPNACE